MQLYRHSVTFLSALVLLLSCASVLPHDHGHAHEHEHSRGHEGHASISDKHHSCELCQLHTVFQSAAVLASGCCYKTPIHTMAEDIFRSLVLPGSVVNPNCVRAPPVA